MARTATSCVLLVEPDRATREILRGLLAAEGLVVETAEDLRSASTRLASAVQHELVISAPRLPGGDVLELLPSIRALAVPPVLLLLVDRSEISQAARLLRLGAGACIGKPVVADEVRSVVEHYLEHQRLVRRCEQLRSTLARQKRAPKLITHEAPMESLLQQAAQFAATRSPVLISGGPGVGKRLLAQWIHAQSPQSRGPCIELECGGSASEALLAQTSAGGGGTPRGTQSDVASALEHAEGGSLIVRHVEDAAPALQDQLLRLAEPDGRRAGRDLARAPSDVRLLFTACTELKSRAESGTFRKDLYYAIKGLSLHIPDLRERSADIVPLARHFLREAAERLGVGTPTLDREAIAAAVRYPWPGNVAELERLMNGLAAQAVNGRILASDFPAASSAPLAPNGRAAILSLRDALAEPERQTIERALRLNDWNRNQTAAMLKVNRSTLFNKMKKYGLLAPGDRA